MLQFFCRKSSEQKHSQNYFHQQHCCSNSNSMVLGHTPGCDFEGLSEKYWGEILERTLSSTSLHALQRAYSPTIMERCNGLQQEMKVFDPAVPDLWKLDKTTQTFDLMVSESMGSSSETATCREWACAVKRQLTMPSAFVFVKWFYEMSLSKRVFVHV